MTGLQPFDPAAVAIIALLNPAVPLVGLVMGRAADQWQKIVVAAFAAALVGSAVLWLATFVGLIHARGLGGEAGAFMLHYVLGLAWSAIGYRFLKRRPG